MCNCVNIDFQTYERQTGMRTPWGKWVSIDTCLLQEIGELWYAGITTISSCCGHNKNPGYIMVMKKDIPLMEGLDYDRMINPNHAKSKQFFYPNTTKT